MRYSITLPVLDNDNRAFDPKARDHLEQSLLTIFGGFTVHYGRGVWRDRETGITYKEDVEIFESYIPDRFGTEYELHHLAKWALHAFRQEAIFCTFGHREMLVAKDTPAPNID